MYCKKCGSPLPSHGYVCKFCGAMFDNDQIKQQKEYNKENKKNFELNFISDKYNKNGTNRNYDKPKENKLLGAIIIILILVLLIIVGILKVM